MLIISIRYTSLIISKY